MPVIRRKPVAPVQKAPVVSAPPAPERKGPIRRNPTPGQKVIPIRQHREERITEDRERNADGISYTETIARYKAKVKNPLTAIRANCVECSGGSLKEVAQCLVVKCALYPFRMGVNPMHKKTRDRLAAQGDDE